MGTRKGQAIDLAAPSCNIVGLMSIVVAPPPGHQQAERHSLGVTVGELRVAGFGEQQPAPVLGKAGQLGMFLPDLLYDFVTKEAAKPG